jgi:hypothetical protein
MTAFSLKELLHIRTSPFPRGWRIQAQLEYREGTGLAELGCGAEKSNCRVTHRHLEASAPHD